MLSDSKTATGTVTFVLTDSPTLSMDMNFAVKGTEHTTYLGVTQEAKISNTSNVLKVNLTKEQTVTITMTISYDDNILIVPESITTAQNKTLSKISNENGVAIYKTADGVTASNGDYIVLDNLLSAIYPTVDASNKNYSIKIETQPANSASASAILSGTYTNTTTQYDVTFNVVGGEYGTITGTGIFADFNSSSTNTYAVPHGTTTRVNDSTITFTDPYNNVLGTLTATAKLKDEQYTYLFNNWSLPSETITKITSITANFTRTTNQYTVTFYNYDGTYLGSSVVDYGGTAAYTGTTPTKPSDDTYMYVFNNSWVTTQNGSEVDDLTNVTADRNVYANFTAVELVKAPIFEANGTNSYNFDLEFMQFGIALSVNDSTEYLKLKNMSRCKITITLRFNSSFGWENFTYTTFKTVNGITFTREFSSSGVAIFKSDDYIDKNDYIILDKLLYPMSFSDETTNSLSYQIEIKVYNDYMEANAVLSGNYEVLGHGW